MTGIKSGILILLMALFSITNYAQSQSDITGEWAVGRFRKYKYIWWCFK